MKLRDIRKRWLYVSSMTTKRDGFSNVAIMLYIGLIWLEPRTIKPGVERVLDTATSSVRFYPVWVTEVHRHRFVMTDKKMLKTIIARAPFCAVSAGWKFAVQRLLSEARPSVLPVFFFLEPAQLVEDLVPVFEGSW